MDAMMRCKAAPRRRGRSPALRITGLMMVLGLALMAGVVKSGKFDYDTVV